LSTSLEDSKDVDEKCNDGDGVIKNMAELMMLNFKNIGMNIALCLLLGQF